VNRPATASNRVGKLGFAKRGAVVQPAKERTAGLKELVDPFHLGVPAEITEAMPFIGDGIVIEEGFEPDALHTKDPAKEVEHLYHFTRQTEPFPDLSREKACVHGPFLFGQVPGSPPEERVPAFLVQLGVEPGRVRVVDNHEIQVYLCEIAGVGELDGIERVLHFLHLDFGQAGSVTFRAKETNHLFPPFTAQRERVDPETMIKGRRYEDSAKPFLFRVGHVADFLNPGHCSPSAMISLEHFFPHVKMKATGSI
jgi:hypothetical protein